MEANRERKERVWGEKGSVPNGRSDFPFAPFMCLTSAASVPVIKELFIIWPTKTPFHIWTETVAEV